MVIVVIEESCAGCAAPLSATIEMSNGGSRTCGDFHSEHAVDVQSAGPDRVLKAIHVGGICGKCGAAFSFKAFSVMQSQARREMRPGQ